MDRERLRQWFSRNLHSIVFLGAFFATTVLGNLVYLSPTAGQALALSGLSADFLAFPNTFTFGDRTLLLCPFVVTPIVVAATKRLAGPSTADLARALPEFRPWEYAVVTGLCFGFVIYRFWVADVAALFVSGADANTSVEARFLIRERLGFFTLLPLQALLPYLTIYALIAWMRSRRLSWMIFSLVDFFVLSVLLVMINMKWPVLLFYITIVLTIFVFSKRYAYLKAAVGSVFVVVTFLVISTFVFRLAPAPTAAASAGLSKKSAAVSDVPERLVAATKAVPANTATILILALNRMAISYPYYYQVFTEEGPVCGGILAQARRKPVCRPSEMIFTRIFGSGTHGTDEFESGGTSPMAVHVSGYALGGWPIAMLALVAGSILLGLFSALPIDKGSASDSLVILGAVAAYHLSQIPGEGVILYQHGLLWTFLLIGVYVLWRRVLFRPGADVLNQTAAD